MTEISKQLIGQPLCERLDGDTLRLDLSEIEIGFLPREWSAWFGWPPKELGSKPHDYFTHRVTRTSGDLLMHVHRIVSYYYTGNPERVYGALLDLFIVLNDKGYPLRKRLLTKVAPILERDQLKALGQGLLAGIKEVDNVPISPFSRLSDGIVGRSVLVEQQEGAAAQVEFDILDEARDLIDSGFIDDAQNLLEDALASQPEHADISKELLTVYRYTKNRDAFFATRERMEGLPLAAKELWDELADKFKREYEDVENG